MHRTALVSDQSKIQRDGATKGETIPKGEFTKKPVPPVSDGSKEDLLRLQQHCACRIGEHVARCF